MNREELKKLGLTDEQIDKVMLNHGTVVNATKEQLETVTTERDDLKGQLADRDDQLNALKDVDPDKLKQEIADLQESNDNAKTEYEANLKDLQLTNAIKLSLNGKVHDEELASGLIDKEKLVVDGDKIVGLDDQIQGLKESKSFLFKQEQESHKPNFTTGNHSKGDGTLTKEQIMQEPNNTKRQRLIQENRQLFQ